MAFKVKTKNRNPINTKQTLDATHHEIIDQYEQDLQQVPEFQNQVNCIDMEISSINKQIQERRNEPLFVMKLQERIWKLDDERSSILRRIENISNKEEETKYLLKTGAILQKYYKLIANEGDTTEDEHNHSSIRQSSLDKKSVLDWFSSAMQEPSDLEVSVPVDIPPSKDTSTETKGLLYDHYMTIIQKDYVPETDTDHQKIDICDVCKSEMLLNQNLGTLICVACGVQDYILIDSDKPSYKDPPKEMTSFCYKRINHLNEFLAQFQAKETTEIDEDIYNEILVEIKKERISNMADLTPEKLRLILRKIKRNDYYEHIPYIINQLNGLPPPVISPEVEEIIRNMFKEVQIPFDLYCPPKRKNFLSYNFIMYKFFELLEMDEYLERFQLLKSRTKLHQQDLIWKDICNYLAWEFIPSL